MIFFSSAQSSSGTSARHDCPPCFTRADDGGLYLEGAHAVADALVAREVGDAHEVLPHLAFEAG